MLSFAHLHVKYHDLPPQWQPVYSALLYHGFTYAATHMREIMRYGNPSNIMKGLGYGDCSAVH